MSECSVAEEIGNRQSTVCFHGVDGFEGDPEGCELDKSGKEKDQGSLREGEKGNRANGHVEGHWREEGEESQRERPFLERRR